jgi:predicted solute-binding protein
VDKNEERRRLDEEKEKRERAKQANRIYRKVCQDAGLEVSFFQDFVSWSDYVEGKIDEEEFYDRARAEVKRVLARSHAMQ